MITGSVASTYYSGPRTTQDIDIVIDPTPRALRALVDGLEAPRFYANDADPTLARRDEFPVIDTESGWKVDLIIRRDRPFSRSEFERRQRVEMDSERQVEPQCLIEGGEEFGWEHADAGSDALHVDRSDLFGLGLGIPVEPGFSRHQQHLERMDALGVRSDRDDSDHSPPEPLRSAIGPVVADDHRGPALVRFRSPHRFEVDEADLASPHQTSPSPTVGSQPSFSPSPAHSSQASS